MVNYNVHEHETRQINDLVVAIRIEHTCHNLTCFPATGIRFYNALPVTIKIVPRPRFKHIVQS